MVCSARTTGSTVRRPQVLRQLAAAAGWARTGWARPRVTRREPEPGPRGVLDQQRRAQRRHAPAADLLGQVAGVEALLGRPAADPHGRVVEPLPVRVRARRARRAAAPRPGGPRGPGTRRRTCAAQPARRGRRSPLSASSGAAPAAGVTPGSGGRGAILMDTCTSRAPSGRSAGSAAGREEVRPQHRQQRLRDLRELLDRGDDRAVGQQGRLAPLRLGGGPVDEVEHPAVRARPSSPGSAWSRWPASRAGRRPAGGSVEPAWCRGPPDPLAAVAAAASSEVSSSTKPCRASSRRW